MEIWTFRAKYSKTGTTQTHIELQWQFYNVSCISVRVCKWHLYNDFAAKIGNASGQLKRIFFFETPDAKDKGDRNKMP